MAQIVAVFRDTYGPEHMHNLEQVVRDLANKTDKLERTEFGGFRLTESSARA
ncbi:hypothetical protein [Acanthopleuribacter pedis]|uniref:Uncharacterized protein n=1 Tax=Acanthopleuribacter pedis TaxID=442870 RepID=A0A8J7U8D8_9BACT|nr:hypothetical protein [Acanthopleuribacter pedis]MBO1322431.1 hypothetical protein [Acanthopleuribacter pedis]